MTASIPHLSRSVGTGSFFKLSIDETLNARQLCKIVKPIVEMRGWVSRGHSFQLKNRKEICVRPHLARGLRKCDMASVHDFPPVRSFALCLPTKKLNEHK